MTDELVEREAARKAGSTESASLLRVLEILHRLHDAADEDGVLSAAAEAFSALLGSAPSVLRVKHDGVVARRHPAEALGEAVIAIMDRAARQGLAVIDPSIPGAAAFPIRASDRPVGSVYVAHNDPAVVKGRALDLLRIVACHVGLATVALDARAAAACTPAAASRVGPNLPFKDAKLEFERRIIDARLRETRGNVAAAARSLDIDRGQLSRLMKRHDIDRGAFRVSKGRRVRDATADPS